MIIAGYASVEEVLSYAEEVASDYGIDVLVAREHVHRTAAERFSLEATWPDTTVNDRITAAFKELNERGIVALENAGYTMSDGWCDVGDAAEDLEEPARGGCFFHWQDIERGVRGDGLLLAFGAEAGDYGDDGDSEKRSVELAREICEVLSRHEVANEWDGDVNKRIQILPFKWQRRHRPRNESPNEGS